MSHKKFVYTLCIIGVVLFFFTSPAMSNLNTKNQINTWDNTFYDLQHSITGVVVNSTLEDTYFDIEDYFWCFKVEFIDQQQTEEAGSGLNVNYGQYVAQSFKPSVPRLSKVYLKLFKYGGNPDYDLEFSVRKTLSGNNLAYITKNAGQIANGWNEFDFSDLFVEIDNTYYLVCEGDGGEGGDPIYCWYCKDGNPYSRGMTYVYNYGSWHSVTDVDCCFKTAYTNDPPNQPGNPDPFDGESDVGFDADLSWTCSDPDEDALFYDVYFEADDSSPDVLVSSNQTDNSFDPGFLDGGTTFYWKIIADDGFGVTTSSPVWSFSTVDNEPPNTPIVSGETNGKVRKSYVYTASSTDIDGDQIYYWFDWGDNTSSGWVGPYDSGATASESHIWNDKGTFIIKIKAKDIYDQESTWASLTITMPKNKAFNFNFSLLNWLFEHFAYAFPILRYISDIY